MARFNTPRAGTRCQNSGWHKGCAKWHVQICSPLNQHHEHCSAVRLSCFFFALGIRSICYSSVTHLGLSSFAIHKSSDGSRRVHIHRILHHHKNKQMFYSSPISSIHLSFLNHQICPITQYSHQINRIHCDCPVIVIRLMLTTSCKVTPDRTSWGVCNK